MTALPPLNLALQSHSGIDVTNHAPPQAALRYRTEYGDIFGYRDQLSDIRFRHLTNQISLTYGFLYRPSPYSSSYSEISGCSTTTGSSMSPRSDILTSQTIMRQVPRCTYSTSRFQYSLHRTWFQCIQSSFAIQPCDFVHTAQGLVDFGYESQPQDDGQRVNGLPRIFSLLLYPDVFKRYGCRIL